MHIQENTDLRRRSTMRLGGRTRYLAEAHSDQEVQELVHWARERGLPFMIIGHGSNIVWQDAGYKGLIIVNRLMGREVLSKDAGSVLVRAAGGEKWDDIVAWTVEKALHGIEFLSAIPGTVGAAPVQNIGAYGAELSDVLVEVEAYDTKEDSFGGIAAEACGFAYRSSRFKTTDRGRFMILGVTLRLHKSNPSPPFYESLQKYLTQQPEARPGEMASNDSRSQDFTSHFPGSDLSQPLKAEYTPQEIRDAVIAIRKLKLPDPSVANNNGSFFTNPLIPQAQFEELKRQFPDIKAWPAPAASAATGYDPVACSGGEKELVKVSAGWLVEQCGFKGVHDTRTGMATWPHSALVVINEHAQSTADLLTFRQKILDAVQSKFGIILEQEPELLP